MTLTSPSGVVITYVERLRPLQNIVELIKATPPPVGFTPARATPIQDIVTREGETAALVFVEGEMNGSPAELAFGFVLLDDFYSRVLGIVRDPHELADFRTAVAELVASDAHFLGRVRRRRFRYTPPAHWIERRQLFECHWFAPNDARAITVAPALPKLPGLSETLVLGVLGNADPDHAGPLLPVSTRNGLHGQHWQFARDQSTTDLVILEDNSFLYSVRLDTRAPDPSGADVLRELVESICPIPAPAAATSSAALVHWAE